MRNYQLLGLLLVAGVLGFVLGYRTGATGEQSQRAVATCPAAAADDCCTLPTRPAKPSTPPPVLPPASGLPGLVEFGSDECDACRRMLPVLEEVAKRYQGRLEVVLVDTDDHPTEAQKWRLRLIPTQILISPQGEELWRHEGFIPLADLQQVLQDQLPRQ
jgi:thioredoxin 1